MSRPRTNHPLARISGLSDLKLEDVEAVRHLLRGGSVVDWHKLDFEHPQDVDRFLRVNEFDPESDEDMDLLEQLREQAVDYLLRNFEMSVPEDIAVQVPARDLFLMASRKGRRQTWACVVLKIMHICHHLAGRETAIQLPISNDNLYRAVELKVMTVVEELRAAGFPVTEFEWSRKPPDSLVTKLLAKRSTLAANVYDKLRFRLTVPEHDDLIPMLTGLLRRMIPFNYVVPGESVNHLIELPKELLPATGAASEAPRSDSESEVTEVIDVRSGPVNEFSGRDYRIINFVADLPLRVESVAPDHAQDAPGHIVFVLCEFQLCDRDTARQNDLGDNNHELYKQRQRTRVRERLLRGFPTDE